MVIGFAGGKAPVTWGGKNMRWRGHTGDCICCRTYNGRSATFVAIMQTSVRRLLPIRDCARGLLRGGIRAIGRTPKRSFGATAFTMLHYAADDPCALSRAVVEAKIRGDKLSDFSGLSRAAATVLSFCMLIFLLSLAGIPTSGRLFWKILSIHFNADCPTKGTLCLLWMVF